MYFPDTSASGLIRPVDAPGMGDDGLDPDNIVKWVFIIILVLALAQPAAKLVFKRGDIECWRQGNGQVDCR
jgi:hypothetical protein